MPKFWQLPLAELQRQLGSDPGGLSSAEAAVRRNRSAPTFSTAPTLVAVLKFLGLFAIRWC